MRVRTLALLALGLLAACRGDQRGERRAPPRVVLTVSAAASLSDAFAELAREYRAAHPDVEVRTNFGASGALRQQIEQGAPVDVFASAAEGPMDDLQERGLIDPRSRRVLAGNDLVLVIPAGSASPVKGFADLASPAVGRVAIGAPASVPAGEYAEEVLRSLGIADAVRKKAVYAQHVRQVLAYVARGEVDAGIVYRTDAASSDRVRVAAEAPPGTHRPITYPVAVVRGSRHPQEARDFVGFVLGPAGQAALRRHGFRVEG